MLQLSDITGRVVQRQSSTEKDTVRPNGARHLRDRLETLHTGDLDQHVRTACQRLDRRLKLREIIRATQNKGRCRVACRQVRDSVDRQRRETEIHHRTRRNHDRDLELTGGACYLVGKWTSQAIALQQERILKLQAGLCTRSSGQER